MCFRSPLSSTEPDSAMPKEPEVKRIQHLVNGVLFSASEARANHIFCHIYFTILHQISHSIHTIPNILSSGSGSKSGWPWISPNRPPSSIHSSPMWTSANQSQKRHGSSSLRRFQHTSLEHTSQPFTTWLMKEIFSYLDFFGYLSEVCSKGVC